MVKAKIYKLIPLIAALWMPLCITAQKADTMPAVEIRRQMAINIAATANPVQQLSKNTLSLLNSVSVADAAKYLPGVAVKDYGGIGGLKTISVRSLGATHTAVLLDGIPVGDAQGGQIDMGRFSLENIESVQLYAHQPAGLLMAARAFASASVIALASSSGVASEKTLLAKMKTGSFGYLHPSLTYKGKPGKKISHSLFGEYQYANGGYSFKDYETGTSRHKRNNSDIKMFHAEYDVAFRINDSNSIGLKSYYYNSKRGLPGAIVYFNGAASQRLHNESWFAQFSWKNKMSDKSSLLLLGKYAYDYKFYLDPSYPNSAHKLENIFRQKELYVSSAYSYKVIKHITAAIASDFFYSKLRRTDTFVNGFANPSRNTWLNNISIQYKTSGIEILAHLLHTNATHQAEAGPVAKNYAALTPAVSLSAQIKKDWPVRMRASFKKIFRMPTFDDLYYTNIGNTNLKPEYAYQYNTGITVALAPLALATEIIITTDAYYNRVKDKIIATPRFNLFQWSMENVDTVDIRGLDAAVNIKWRRFAGIDFSSRVSYTYQRALNMISTKPELYKKQLPYTPVHTASVHLAFNRGSLSVAFNTLATTHRYGMGPQQADNLAKAFITQDISIGCLLLAKPGASLQATAELNNIFNSQYEIIKFYPMPGFNWRLGLSAKF